jgi:threonine/homoserine/homoserine lactone efflux protein
LVKVVLGEVLTLALVVTISPLNVIPAILVLFTKKPVVNALSFLAGFIAGVAAILGSFVAVAGAVNLSPDSDHSTWAGPVKFVLGVYLLAAAVRKFRSRPRAGQDASMPKWMGGIAAYSPGKSFAAGVALGALNPKNVIVGLAAAVTVASADLSNGQQAAACAVYVVVAVLGVAAPILVMLLLGGRAPDVLDRWKVWLGQNSATVMAVLFLIFGVILIGQGIGGA